MSRVKFIEIEGRKIGEGFPVFIIAEAGINHNGDIKIAQRMIDLAANAKVNAVKFQTFRTERLVSKNARKAQYQQRTTDSSEGQKEWLKPLELNEEEHLFLKRYAERKGLIFLSTPFDKESVDLLEHIGMAAYKISSCNVTNIPFVDYVSSKRKPISLSTGMSSLGDIEEALSTIYNHHNEVVLLHCTSNYPVNVEDSNLRCINTLRSAFGLPVGYSDHNIGNIVSYAAVAMGAVIIERHFTLDRNMPGADHRASLNPDELRDLVASIRLIEKSMGSPIKKVLDSEMEIKEALQKSIVADMDIKKSETIEERMLTTKRPGTGIPPKYLKFLLNRKAKVDIPEDTLITWKMLI